MNKFSEIDFSELTKLVVSRIQKLEPENAIKILGCLFLSSPSEQRMFQLAFWSEDEIQPIISDAKATLNMLSAKHAELAHPCWEPPFTPDQQHPIHNLNFVPRPYVDDCNQPHFLSLEERLDNLNPYGPNLSNHCYYHDDTLGGNLNMRVNGRSPSLPEYAIKACHYFYKGYCKHGADCRYFHGHCIPEGDSQIYNANLDELENEDHGFSPGSLEKLEKEITELLKARGRMPISIASLPMMYFEKYGRNLQAEGYLTESQRHGKAGFNLTKLLARLKNSIRLIDRPHGQHSVILAEDAPRYTEYMNQMGGSGAITSSSHQIYLTFPAESTFTAEDVSNYFKQFGPVRDVRIPCQEKRMFGFVSFLYPETARIILTKRNPHFICGARVLVKPYKEKSRTPDRAHNEKFQSVVQYPPFLAMDSELYAAQRQFNNSRLIRKQEIEQQERMMELERRRLAEFGLSLRPPVQPCYNYSMEVPEGPNELPSTDRFSYTLDALNNDSMNDEKAKNTDSGYDNHESQFDLPESPFASPPVENGIAALM